jgi:hypothetical protein
VTSVTAIFTVLHYIYHPIFFKTPKRPKRIEPMVTKSFFKALAVIATVSSMACSDSTGSGQATLTLQLTDAPSDLLSEAIVTLGQITLHPDSGDPIVLTSDGGTHDLLLLQNGVTASLASLQIPEGRYQQLRMIVTSASVTLANGLTFNDGTNSKTLKVPSGAQTGIKIKLQGADGTDDSGGIDIVQGETILVIDFDVSQNFVVQGNANTPAGINGILFTPSLRAIVRNIAGSIAGTVTSAGGASLAGLSVMAEQTDAAVPEALQTTSASTVVDSVTGQYTIQFLAPGTYTVDMVDVIGSTPATGVVVAEGAESTQDFQIP